MLGGVKKVLGGEHYLWEGSIIPCCQSIVNLQSGLSKFLTNTATSAMCQTPSKTQTDRRQESNVVHFSLKMWPSVAIILMIFLIINWLKSVCIYWLIPDFYHPPPLTLKFLWSIALCASTGWTPLTNTMHKRTVAACGAIKVLCHITSIFCSAICLCVAKGLLCGAASQRHAALLRVLRSQVADWVSYNGVCLLCFIVNFSVDDTSTQCHGGV